MRIELLDLDCPYDVAIDMNDNGDPIIRIEPQTGNPDRDTDYDICLDKDGVLELIRVLQFVVGEL